MKLFFLIIFASNLSLAQQSESDSSLFNFQSIKGLLKSDKLEDQAMKKQNEIKKKLDKKKRVSTSQYSFPSDDEMWGFLSELWLVKNAQRLKWDFEKPDYGLSYAVEQVFEQFGFFEKKFKILLINSPNVTHFALPSNPGEYIFVLSVPFIRNMDLTKREIAILILEDYIRNEMGFFRKYVMEKELQSLIGTNFYNKTFDPAIIEKVLNNYSVFVFEKGFNFQQQYEVTKRLDGILKSDLKIWNSYLVLLKKIDKLVKSNTLFKDYNNIYPSAEIQIKWITPQKKIL